MMGAVVAGWAVLAALFTAVAMARLTWRGRAVGQRHQRGARRPVLLLRPLDAPTAIELQNLAAPLPDGQLTHLVLAPQRPALAHGSSAQWVRSDPTVPNRKVGHLLGALAQLPREADQVVLAIDADVRVDAALVEALLGAIASGAAVAFAAPEPSASPSLAGWASRGLLVQSHHSFRALDAMSAGAKAMCGKALALSTVALEELGGLERCIGEDLELSTRLWRRGLSVVLVDAPACVPQPPQPSLAAAAERFTRWMQVLRAHRPLLFPSVPLLFACTPVLVVLAAVSCSSLAFACVAGVLLARCLLAALLDSRGGLRLEWVAGEALLLWCWLRSLWLGSTVQWRGRRWRLGAHGVMQ